ncbi:MAG: hypothetical protein HQK81_12425 [Desulfovibrionaceae bacterium]|nr:hypothetical protein [Desulfovibrionaceae bacterium]MBF0514849.1 hypothetical protein [Desulfovibrionaceae bacterium]
MGATNLREERFHRILTDVEPQLKARQDRMALMPEIWNLRRDIEYVKDQIEVAQAKRAQLAAQAASLKPETAALKESVERLRVQKTTITGKSGLEELERGLREKIRAFPKIKEEIGELEKELPALTARLAELERDHEKLLAKSREIEPEAAKIRETVSSLEEEIFVLSSTRDIVGGLVPADIDPEVFDSIRDDLRERFQAYLGDVQESIEAIAKQTEDMKSAMPGMRKEKVALAARRETLKLAAGDLDAWFREPDALEALRAQAAGLADAQAAAARRRAEALRQLEGAQAELAGLREMAERARAACDQAAQRLAALTMVKEKIAQAGDLGTAVANLAEQADKCAVAARVNLGVVREGLSVAERLERVNAQLNEAGKPLRAVAEKFDRLVDGGLQK